MSSDLVACRRAAKAKAYANQEPSPLTVMLGKMRFEFAIAQAEAAKGAAADQNIIRKALDSAHAAAKDCAPYVHRRLSSLHESDTQGLDPALLSDEDLETMEQLFEKYLGNSEKAA
jgi:hypothetical protein